MRDIDWSCPSDLEPYAKAHNLEEREIDSRLYNMGIYNKIAYEVVMSHFGAGIAGKRSSAKYIEEPLLRIMDKNKPLTKEEKQREVDMFFARENARRVNWRRSKNKK